MKYIVRIMFRVVFGILAISIVYLSVSCYKSADFHGWFWDSFALPVVLIGMGIVMGAVYYIVKLFGWAFKSEG